MHMAPSLVYSEGVVKSFNNTSISDSDLKRLLVQDFKSSSYSFSPWEATYLCLMVETEGAIPDRSFILPTNAHTWSRPPEAFLKTE